MCILQVEKFGVTFDGLATTNDFCKRYVLFVLDAFDSSCFDQNMLYIYICIVGSYHTLIRLTG